MYLYLNLLINIFEFIIILYSYIFLARYSLIYILESFKSLLNLLFLLFLSLFLFLSLLSLILLLSLLSYPFLIIGYYNQKIFSSRSNYIAFNNISYKLPYYLSY